GPAYPRVRAPRTSRRRRRRGRPDLRRSPRRRSDVRPCGQQAPVVFYSTTSSSGTEIPRGLEFLLSRNRLNVAISLAPCLAYSVGNPRLLDVRCRTVEQMRMANALCRAVEMAEGQRT